MSNMEQMMDNIQTFSERKPLSSKEWDTLLEIAESMKDSISSAEGNERLHRSIEETAKLGRNLSPKRRNGTEQ